MQCGHLVWFGMPVQVMALLLISAVGEGSKPQSLILQIKFLAPGYGLPTLLAVEDTW